jgi:predicted nucleic acid-binding protein
MKAYLGTAVLVAPSVSDHSHHRQSLATVQLIRNKSIAGCTTGHALSEAYAVWTRTPFTPPVHPPEAWNLLSSNILPYFEIISVTAQMYRDTIKSCANHGWIAAGLRAHLRFAPPVLRARRPATVSTPSTCVIANNWLPISPIASELPQASLFH